MNMRTQSYLYLFQYIFLHRESFLHFIPNLFGILSTVKQ